MINNKYTKIAYFLQIYLFLFIVNRQIIMDTTCIYPPPYIIITGYKIRSITMVMFVGLFKKIHQPINKHRHRLKKSINLLTNIDINKLEDKWCLLLPLIR